MKSQDKDDLVSSVANAIEDSNWQLAAARDQSALRLAIAKNVAVNGRLAVAMIFIVAVAAYLKEGDALFARLALGAAIPVGLAYVVDPLPGGRMKIIGAALALISAAIVAALLFLNVR
jgi:hypothetical protein